MIVIPAVDVLGGRAVRLLRGDYDRVTETRGDPVALARAWAAAGARLIHVVDLDGARAGERVNGAVIERLCRAPSATTSRASPVAGISERSRQPSVAT